MSSEKDKIHSNRIEDKYIIERRQLESFLKLFKAFMKPYYPPGAEKAKFVVNRSTYFDTPNLDDLRDHLEGYRERKKIRIRSYIADGKKIKAQFLEMKSKEGDKSLKTRIQIGKAHFAMLMNISRINVDEELKILNEDLMDESDLVLQVGTLNSILKEGKYKPIIQIDYKRSAFQNGEDFRVTLDQDLKFTSLPDMDVNALKELEKDLKKHEPKFINYEDIIIEVKHKDDELPKWLKNKFDKHCMEDEPFSKYCWSMARTVKEK
jgi:VTC domain